MTNEKHVVDSTREELKQEIHAYKNEPSVLSPAAQAIEDAVDNAWSNSRARAAAALRAAADQGKAMEIPFSVVTDWEKVKGSCASFYAAAEWGYYQALREQRAIADELEGHA